MIFYTIYIEIYNIRQALPGCIGIPSVHCQCRRVTVQARAGLSRRLGQFKFNPASPSHESLWLANICNEQESEGWALAAAVTPGRRRADAGRRWRGCLGRVFDRLA